MSFFKKIVLAIIFLGLLGIGLPFMGFPGLFLSALLFPIVFLLIVLFDKEVAMLPRWERVSLKIGSVIFIIFEILVITTSWAKFGVPWS